MRANGQVGAFREILAEETIGIFVRPALPRALRVTEVDLDVRGDRELLVSRHLQAAIPGQRFPQPGATRFGGRIGLELRGYNPTDILDMQFVKKPPMAWTPEPLRWIGVTLTRNEMARADRNTGRQLIAVDPRYFRPTEVDTLLGDPSKAKKQLGWQAKTPFADLVKEMVAADHEAAKRDALVKEAGYQAFDYHE